MRNSCEKYSILFVGSIQAASLPMHVIMAVPVCRTECPSDRLTFFFEQGMYHGARMATAVSKCRRLRPRPQACAGESIVTCHTVSDVCLIEFNHDQDLCLWRISPRRSEQYKAVCQPAFEPQYQLIISGQVPTAHHWVPLCDWLAMTQTTLKHLSGLQCLASPPLMDTSYITCKLTMLEFTGFSTCIAHINFNEWFRCNHPAVSSVAFGSI